MSLPNPCPDGDTPGVDSSAVRDTALPFCVWSEHAGLDVASYGYRVRMSRLSARQRANLSPSAFGLPERARTKEARQAAGNYPIPDRGHAISALRRSERELERGNLTQDEFDRIQRKAKRMLKKKTR